MNNSHYKDNATVGRGACRSQFGRGKDHADGHAVVAARAPRHQACAAVATVDGHKMCGGLMAKPNM